MKRCRQEETSGRSRILDQKTLPKSFIGVEASMEMFRTALIEIKPGPKHDQVLLALLELFQIRRRDMWWKDPGWLSCFNAAKRIRRDPTTKERGQWLVCQP